MVQMPVHPSVNWKSARTVNSYRFITLDFAEKEKRDPDLIKCVLRWAILQGAVLRIRKDDKRGIIAQIDQKPIIGYEKFIEELIDPLIKKLEAKIYDHPEKNDDGYSTSYWTAGLSGVTKIKLKGHTYKDYKGHSVIIAISYTIQHKMGRDGGANYHITGIFEGLDKPKQLK
jgi:hypothetical protein